MPRPTLDEYLGADDDGFVFGNDQCGAFGGVFGGVLAACCLQAARRVASGRRPFALDVSFVRALRPGRVVARTELVRAGRTLSCVAVELVAADEPDRLATRASVLLAAPEVLAGRDARGATGALRAVPPHAELKPIAEAPRPIPIIDSLAPRTARLDDGAIVSSVEVPWADEGTAPEAACVAADLCVGAPVFAGMGRPWLPHPNPDLSIRFTGAASTDHVAGVGRLESLVSGVATVRTEVWAADSLTASGVSTSLLLDDP